MATLAQTINVLQAVALTDGKNALLTPTYYIMRMFRDHGDNTLLGSFLTTEYAEYKGRKLPLLTESASMDRDGKIYATVVNADPSAAREIHCQIADHTVQSVRAEIVTEKFDAYNTFEDKYKVRTKLFTDFTRTPDGFTAKLPACSIVKFTIV